MAMPSEQEMRAARAARDKTYDGRFFVAVITTGVFCRPSCTARAARPENLRFFPDADSAMASGFRPCKRCRPTDIEPELGMLVKIARHIETHADEHLTLGGLAKQAGLSPSHFQRVFKSAFGVSPKAYQDAFRMKRFKVALKKGDDVTGAIFAAGFGSISRVYGEEARNIGMTPKAYRAGGAGETIAHACRDTALGPIIMAATERGVCFVQFGKDAESLLEQLRAEFPKAKLIASAAQDTPELDAWIEALDAHISQGAPRPDLPLDLHGTAFQMMVWRFLLSVREGDLLSYGELAARIEKPKAVRAVASACAANRIVVLVPCHRVLRGNGELGGYRGGVERKRSLLDMERRSAAQME
ncbi:MAG: bifunctional DNA-binding transcriptional regulator/O6-methylguanine-DNA methyltransferase Ada [Caldilineaceae bacterium SB0661_bin_34]|nr:bifunctional DNA-binding transcriptional regulator/O6-methylguanine-DNA methyltransferase Ada [Caldilineaceae bacterium SB0661_bin_34]